MRGPSAEESPAADQAEPVLGFLLHVFARRYRGRPAVNAVGRLATGETFALIDQRPVPHFHVRASDRGDVERLAGQARVDPTDRTTMDGEAVLRVRCRSTAELRDLAERLQGAGIRTYEADVPFVRKYLIDLGICGSVRIAGPWKAGRHVDRVYINPWLEPAEWEPQLAVLVIDIETDVETEQVYAASLVGAAPDGSAVEEVHLIGSPSPGDPDGLTCHADEPALLAALARRVREIDPDILTGWNVVDFDLPVLTRRFAAHKLAFNLGRTRDASSRSEGRTWGAGRMVIHGRQVVDAMHLVRAMGRRFEDFRLDTVARSILGRGKTLGAGAGESMPEVIRRAYRQDRPGFCRYCLEDSRLVRDILAAERLIELCLRRSLLTGLPLERVAGSVAAFEFLYMTELHRRGMVAPTTGVDRPAGGGAPGGLVLMPQAGLYRNVLAFDFKSLYPSIIRTFNIDPLAHVRAGRGARRSWEDQPDPEVVVAPNGAAFDRRPGILPGVLERFFADRDRARAEGNAVASFTYKIIMNSFYGVLGTAGCRFAGGALAGAVTGFGQYILRWCRDLLDARGVRVLYGDTDSLFVDAGLDEGIDPADARRRGREICESVNAALARHVRERFDLTSRLELEFEKHYRRLLLPSMRGRRDRGRAKGYAGLVCDPRGERLEIVGMEAVRRDWTRLAHALQRDLLELLFGDAGTERIERRVREWIADVRAGRRDADLVYRKGLRKPVADYVRTTPPHVKAARMLAEPGGVIHYVMTLQGPQPVGHVTAALDYGHYVEKQIAPIVRTIAQVCPIDVDAAVKGEPGLFRDLPPTDQPTD